MNLKGLFREKESLARHCYYRIGGVADEFAVPEGETDLLKIAEDLHKNPRPYAIIGAGSNLLVSDEGFRGLVIKTTHLNSKLEFHSAEERLTVGASVLVSTLLRQASVHGWEGLSFLAGVPGTLGGVAVMNAGTHLGEFKNVVRSVRTYCLGSASWKVYQDEELTYQYRANSFLSSDEVVFEVDLKVQPSDPAEVKRKIDGVLLRRKETQPLEYPSCGSVFKNPKDAHLHAWEVIDRLGLRGFRIGNAEFSKKHCNFIVNLGEASAKDVRNLIDLAKKRASSELKIHLEEEVKYLGRF